MKLLGLHINSELKWNVLVSELVIRKVSTRLYFVTQLKKSRVATRELLLFTSHAFALFWSMAAQFFIVLYQMI